MEFEKKRVLMKFLGVILLAASVILLIRSDRNYVLIGLVVFSMALVVLIIYSLKRDEYKKKIKK